VLLFSSKTVVILLGFQNAEKKIREIWSFSLMKNITHEHLKTKCSRKSLGLRRKKQLDNSESSRVPKVMIYKHYLILLVLGSLGSNARPDMWLGWGTQGIHREFR
jgi:hypothetical protein